MKRMKRALGFLVLIVIMGAGIKVFGFFGIGGTNWKEEVLLHDGRKVIVERSVERGGRHEIGQRSPYRQQSLSFTMPDSKQEVVWEDNFSKELGMANFLPMLLDIHNNAAYLVVSPMGCLSYNKWGRPNPPYVVFIFEGSAWRRIPLEELPVEIEKPNLIFSAPDLAVEKAGTRFMSVEMIQTILSSYKQPEYRSIFRESLDPSKIDCTEMIRVSDGWVGIEWFKSQTTYEQCLKICKLKKLGSDQCPCSRLFNKIHMEEK